MILSIILCLLHLEFSSFLRFPILITYYRKLQLINDFLHIFIFELIEISPNILMPLRIDLTKYIFIQY